MSFDLSTGPVSAESPAPILSILTTCRNNLTGLCRTHQRLAMHDLTGVEWLVQDGGSRDGTVETLTGLTDPAACWRSIDDAGPYDGMNQLLQRACGRFVWFLNAGDSPADPPVITTLTAILADDPALDILYGDAWEETPSGWDLKGARSHHYIWAGLFTHHQAIVYRRAMIADLRYPTDYRIAADYAFTLDALARASIVRRVNWPLCHFAAGGLSQRQARLGRREQARIRRQRLGIPRVVDAFIQAGQAGTLALRRHFPGLYGRLRYRRD